MLGSRARFRQGVARNRSHNVKREERGEEKKRPDRKTLERSE
jgi:hypothetical protein